MLVVDLQIRGCPPRPVGILKRPIALIEVVEKGGGLSKDDSLATRALAWDHGCLAVQTLAAMIGPATFVLDDGRQCNPLHIAPWARDPGSVELPGVLRKLRGEWPCVPFGSDAKRELSQGWTARGETFAGADTPHGPSSNEVWRWADAPDGSLALRLDYPEAHPVRSVTRRVTPDPNAAAIDFELAISVRRECLLPIGLHPVFRVPSQAGMLVLSPARYDHGRTYPGTLEPGAALFAENRRFQKLEEAPRRGGGTIDAAALPFADNIEDLLQLVGADGELILHYCNEGFRARLTWDKTHFPSLLLWYSNRGRQAYPWSGRHLALGVEPVCSAFDLGPAISAGPNPIAEAGTPTARRFTPNETFVTRYRISVEPDDAD